ncbi:LLM class flavin-dependent oxidoreductase [Dactylosporangium vinaceum]|uniref:LLM class flavin-dependent oxidoreductase n=1 Tax=Dactylosporangium vinaceum TaxID=53362 RepID=A0ABV5M9Y0_9ACTN|nr:LLM class flavin-dependent oxidoreductase [Dactylosporangium vinaceum]UAB93143.1 LLM class flavin-dependent oxidoreductase [Dactylosporangium vinaceum]
MSLLWYCRPPATTTRSPVPGPRPGAGYDPPTGRRLLLSELDRAARAERLGFAATWLVEQHRPAAGGSPDPVALAAYVAARTHRIRIGVALSLPLHADPVRIAESLAQLDVLSSGRVIAAFGPGTPAEYHLLRHDPTTAAERFRESYELILRAWTDPAPFRWDGEHHYRPHVNPWPRPWQRPHPPVWLHGPPGPFMAEAARLHRPYLLDRSWPQPSGPDPSPPLPSLAFCVPVHVAEDDRTAHAEARPHAERLLATAPAPRDLTGWAAGPAPGDMSYEALTAGGHIIVGSPATVTARLAARAGELGADTCVTTAVATMPGPLVARGMELFAAQVMPRLQPTVTV